MPLAASVSATERMVPDAPNAASHSVRRKRAITGSISSWAAVRARFMRFSVIAPSAKCCVLMLTQPM